jgi:nicotinamidase-related amidase
MSRALVVIDLLNDLLDRWDGESRDTLIVSANDLVARFHSRIAGINTHECVWTTAVDAYQRDFDVVLARDCIGSYDAEHQISRQLQRQRKPQSRFA